MCPVVEELRYPAWQGWTSNESSEFEAIRIYNQRTRPDIERIVRTRGYSERITVRYERTDFYSCSLIFVRFVRFIRYGLCHTIGTAFLVDFNASSRVYLCFNIYFLIRRILSSEH